MTKLIALDTETTGLDPQMEAVFEIACVNIDSGAEHVWTIEPHLAVVDAMHPKAAEVNRYHERTSDPDWQWSVPREKYADGTTMLSVLRGIHDVLDGAHIVGAVPDFDTRFLTALFTDENETPPRWHYHLIDVEVLAVGWLAYARQFLGSGLALPEGQRRKAELDELLSLPYRSDDLAQACGVDPPSDDERHTALGDARWVARWYRALTGDEA